MSTEEERLEADREFWKAVRKSASLVENNPAWMQAGVAVSENFVGGRPIQEEEHDRASGDAA